MPTGQAPSTLCTDTAEGLAPPPTPTMDPAAAQYWLPAKALGAARCSPKPLVSVHLSQPLLCAAGKPPTRKGLPGLCCCPMEGVGCARIRPAARLRMGCHSQSSFPQGSVFGTRLQPQTQGQGPGRGGHAGPSTYSPPPQGRLGCELRLRAGQGVQGWAHTCSLSSLSWAVRWDTSFMVELSLS